MLPEEAEVLWDLGSILPLAPQKGRRGFEAVMAVHREGSSPPCPQSSQCLCVWGHLPSEEHRWGTAAFPNVGGHCPGLQVWPCTPMPACLASPGTSTVSWQLIHNELQGPDNKPKHNSVVSQVQSQPRATAHHFPEVDVEILSHAFFCFFFLFIYLSICLFLI